MANFRLLIVLALASLLIGCASVEKGLPASAIPSDASGYIGGHFTVGKPIFTSAFILVNQDTSKEVIFPFSDVKGVQAGNSETRLIAVPPGTYRAKQWFVYNSWWAGHGETKKELPQSAMTEPFAVGKGEVVFLGKFYTEWALGGLAGKVDYPHWGGFYRGERISSNEASALVKAAYPSFSSAQFRCILCVP